MKFDISKFEGKISFNILKVQMIVVLSHHGLKKALTKKEKKPNSMADEQYGA